MNNTKNPVSEANALNQIVVKLRQCEIGTPITSVYALIQTSAAEISAVTLDATHPDGGYEELLPLAEGVNYLIVAVGDIDANSGIHISQP